MVVVSDTTTLSALVVVGQVDLLRKLYEKVLIPVAVRDELLRLSAYSEAVNDFIDSEWVAIRQPQNEDYLKLLYQRLDTGESEAIALALETSANLLIIDEVKGRALARSLSIPIIGLLGVLVDAKQKRCVDAVKPLLEEIITKAGFWISESLKREVLRTVGEE